jgi:hypothetical protein
MKIKHDLVLFFISHVTRDREWTSLSKTEKIFPFHFLTIIVLCAHSQTLMATPMHWIQFLFPFQCCSRETCPVMNNITRFNSLTPSCPQNSPQMMMIQMSMMTWIWKRLKPE